MATTTKRIKINETALAQMETIAPTPPSVQMSIAPPSVATPPRPTQARMKEPKFPLDVFPLGVQTMFTEMVDKQGLNLDFCGTAFLSYAAAAIGAKVRIRVAGEWVAPLCIWTCVIGESGTRKSPVFRFFNKPFLKLERDFQQVYDEKMREYEREYKEWAKEKDNNIPMPRKPSRGDIMVQSGTTEGMKKVLSVNPHGIINFRDELLAILNSMNQYKGKGEDSQCYLEFYEGDATKRNLSSSETTFIEWTNVCITGGTQPSKLPEFVEKGRDDDGFVYRFLFCFPSGLKKNEELMVNGISLETKNWYEKLITQLHGIEFDFGERLEPLPHVVTWCKDGFAYFQEWYKVNAQLFNGSKNSSEKGVLSKLEGAFPRLALLLELLERQCQNIDGRLEPSKICVSKKSCEGAAKLVEYFKFMAAKMQAHISNNPLPSDKISKSGIDWNKVFEAEAEMSSGKIKEKVKLLYGLSERTTANILPKELYAVPMKYGVYTPFDPNEGTTED